jgi:hypothetical protein
MSKEGNQLRLRLAVHVDYVTNGADTETLAMHLHEMAFALKGSEMVKGTPAKVIMMRIGVGVECGQIEHAKEGTQAVAVVGNLSEGFKIVGPFPDFDLAAEAYDGAEAWIATLYKPKDPYAYTQVDPAIEEFLDQLSDQGEVDDAFQEMLDDLVHTAASQAGSSVNNEGYTAQIRYLAERWGLDELKKQIATESPRYARPEEK